MKKYIQILISIISFYTVSFSQTSWFVAANGIGNNLTGIYFIDSQTGWICSKNGNSPVYQSTDGGLSWFTLSTTWGMNPNGIWFSDANNGVISNGPVSVQVYPIWYTLNGGIDWNPIAYLNYQSCDMHSVTYYNGQFWLCGYMMPTGYPPWHTWSEIIVDGGTEYNTFDSIPLNRIRGGVSNVYTVGNKGAVYIGAAVPIFVGNDSANLTGVSFKDANTGYVVGGSFVFKTTNNGGSWARLHPLTPEGTYNDVYFFNKDTGWITCVLSNGTTGAMIFTTNGGTSWTMPYTGISGSEITFVDYQNGWVLCGSSLLKYGIPSSPPSAPALTSPPNNSTGIPVNDTLLWNASSGATSYRLQVSTDSLFNSLFLNDSTITSTQRYVTGMNPLTNYWWRVNAKNSAGTSSYSTPFKFTTILASPPPPVLLSPTNNSTGLPLTDTLRWNTSTGASSYRLQVATDSNFTAFILNDSTITSNSRIMSGLSPLTWYYWRVNAKNTGGTSNYSSVWKFKTIGPASGVALYTPVNNAVNQSITNLLFNWSHAFEQTAHLTVLSYWFALYSDTTQPASIIDSTLTDTLKTVSGLLNNTNYWWKVRAKSQLGYGPFSSYFRFTTIVAAPGPPTLYSPHDHSIVYTPNPLLDWLPVSTATGYRLQLTLDSTFTTILLDTTVSVDSFTVSGLSENKYYWRVNAQNIGGSSQYSETWSFTVNLSNIVRNNNEIPKVFKLYNNYPNPFNPVSKIKFDIPKGSDVKISIYNAIGQDIATLVDSHLVPGSYSVEWNATIYPSGIYFYKIIAGDFIQTKKMILLK